VEFCCAVTDEDDEDEDDEDEDEDDEDDAAMAGNVSPTIADRANAICCIPVCFLFSWA
jgi:hypothetical protein